MRLVFRRLRDVRTLLPAAGGVALVAIALVTGLSGYSGVVVAKGAASSIAAAPPQERSVLLRGPAGGSAASLADREAAVRREFAGGLGPAGVRVNTVGYAAGRQLTGDVGAAAGGPDGLVFASVVFAEELPEHADLISGAWPQAGRQPVQAALAEAVARTIGADVGDRVPITDRFTGAGTELQVTGVWRPRDATDPYWLLLPAASSGVIPQSVTYGPFVLHRDDFTTGYLDNASAGWLASVDIDRLSVAELGQVAAATRRAVSDLPQRVGLGDAGLALSELPQLEHRLQRADLVGRSALLTPLLLGAVLGGYALLLIAMLLTEHRRTETALMRARGAARHQLAGLALREAVLVVLPGAVLAPLAVTRLLPHLAGGPVTVPDLNLWLVAALAAVVCAGAMVLPALRRSGTYVEELAERSRPSRWASAQRGALDLALVGFALLAWVQLRQYGASLNGVGGALGIDPLLAAGPTVAVLAGSAVALRILPRTTRLAERRLERRQWLATTLGVWQAGRRPHAGPVLLLSLAVAVSALALCLASTAERSLHDQADFQVGADLRVIEDGAAPVPRMTELAGLPGVAEVLAAQRDVAHVGQTSIGVLALDAARAPAVMRMRPDLVSGSLEGALAPLATTPARMVELPAGTRRLTGRLVAQVPDGLAAGVRTSAILLDRSGRFVMLELGEARGGAETRFDVALPAGIAAGRLAGFAVTWPGGMVGASRFWSGNGEVDGSWGLTGLSALSADGTVRSLDLTGFTWTMGLSRTERTRIEANVAGLEAAPADVAHMPFSPQPTSMVVVPAVAEPVMAVLVTPEALAALRVDVGDTTRVSLWGGDLQVRIAGTVAAVPGVAEPAAMLCDFATANAALLTTQGRIRPAQEWWLATVPGQQEVAAESVAGVSGVTVLDRRQIATAAAQEPYGLGSRAALSAAALGAIVLALVGIAVDVRATARRRVGEFAVLRTMGAGSGLLARALITEQLVLAGLGVLAGVAVGVGVAALMAPLVVLTPSAGRPRPPAVADVPWLPVAAVALGLLAVCLLLVLAVAVGLRGRLGAAALRMGEER